mmetsp:Transcript_4275/g.16116  ORF Transcript_4275/g.16116 Transcript_4275/m.16116 type:complete len:195 (-) Transcript_4275:1220-1804(-)
MSIKLKRKYSETFEEQTKFANGCTNSTNAFHFDSVQNNNNNSHHHHHIINNNPFLQQNLQSTPDYPTQYSEFAKNKRRRFFATQQDEDNRMEIEKYNGDVYSQYFPKPQDMALGNTSQFCASREAPVKKEKHTNLYTEEQVKKLLQMREREIRIEYDRILQGKLQEQFLNFTKFNQDYISRQFRSKGFDNSYIS